MPGKSARTLLEKIASDERAGGPAAPDNSLGARAGLLMMLGLLSSKLPTARDAAAAFGNEAFLTIAALGIVMLAQVSVSIFPLLWLGSISSHESGNKSRVNA